MLYSTFPTTPDLLFCNLRGTISKQLRPGRQEDAHEFLRYLLDAFQMSALKHEKKKTTIVHKIWGGYLRSQVKCCACGKESNTYDSILDLSLEMKDCSVTEALKHFTAKESLEGNNKYFCKQCNTLQKAIKQLTIFEPPNVLVLHLKRFQYESERESSRLRDITSTKINRFVSFDSELDITSL
ncbi:ubiquitin hydrolase Ubp16 [Reticulomyxa filosa]|uniref:ubiquitinyl hydrolase 1 n=1 Tax=Reticulomyxa filosa TaxID=46433 RepID=X6N8G9_RETFI|nr:ubiquitin hydrolase Ubp16 [Reticulomyxa filosa]|eukprot:ETO22039.1 ubiquitin hydrolase Ubp16 [Reticulomyxa filosa]